MANQLLNWLINAVENIRPRNNCNENKGRSDPVEGEINRLLPSVASARQGNQSSSSSSVSRSIQNANPDPVLRTATFNPSHNYRGCKSRKKQGLARGQKRKRDECERGESSKQASLNDVILLPSPNMTVVPRRWKREELYGNMFAISAVEVHETMSEDDIRQTFNKIFEKKVVGLSETKFNFVRAVGNKIIGPGCQSYDGKVIKCLLKQAPIYIRATQKIESGL